MTSLSLFILRTIHRHGPQSEIGLWHNSSKHESLKAIIIATATLSEENFIERTPAHKIPQRYPAIAPCNGSIQYWQLTQKGSDHIAALDAAAVSSVQKQEVCLGSK